LACLSWISRKYLNLNTDHAWRALSFLKFLRATRPDIVHVHYAYAYYAWLAGLIGCRPLVVTVMGGDVLFEEQGEPTAQGRWLTIQLLKSADYITSKSNYLTAALDRLGGLGHKAERIFWGIPVSKVRRRDAASLRASLALTPQHCVILSPRILQPLYQVHLIVEAMPRLVSRHPNAVLLITEYAADAAYRAQIARRVEALGLEKNVRFCGAVPHPRMPEFYWLADIAVSVPRSDGMPQTLIEAMACETPNILNRLPPYRELVAHQESAYFVDAVPASIADGLNHLLENPQLRATIARNALAIVQREGDLGEQSRRVERRYRELASSVPPRTFRFWHFISMALALRKVRGGVS
jgi:glycosyltransferase involved in cell wall biosynthesis